MGEPYLHYFLYRDTNYTNEQLISAVIEDTKDYVFDDDGIVLTSQGYSGVPLCGRTSLSSRRDDLWKIIDVFVRLTANFKGLVFSISTDDPSQNLFFRECERNEVLPKWVTNPDDFNRKVYGYNGVLHVISPEIKSKLAGKLDVDIIRENSRSTRNILITEAVMQRINRCSAHSFGMQQTSVNIPESIAYIARQRPDLLSAAIGEYCKKTEHDKDLEARLDSMECVMVHVLMNSRDWKAMTAVADIESPCDIVSHRVSLAMIAFDEKYSSMQNGVLDEPIDSFDQVTDSFERARMSALYSALKGIPQSLAHRYQMAKSLVNSKHRAECKKHLTDGTSSSQDTACSGDDEDDMRSNGTFTKNKVFKKKRGEFGKKRTLAAILPTANVPRLPVADEDLPTPTSSGQLRNFERAVNGDDVYKESSEEHSLGEEDDMDLFVVRRKAKDITNKTHTPRVLSDATATVSEDDGGFDVTDLIHSVPPMATKDNFEDFDDI